MALTARPTSTARTGVLTHALTGTLTIFLTATLTALVALTGLVLVSAPAHAETGYRYWGYYRLEGGSWSLAQKGAQSITPDDGSVEGFRYATTVGTTARPPRATPTFADICAETEASGDQKRVGIVLDYGTTADATGGDEPPRPEAACAVVPADATTQQALESVQPVRVDSGLICGIGGYPSSGCAAEVQNASAPKDEQQVDLLLPTEAGQQESAEGNGGTTAVAAVAVVVVLLGGGAFVLARRRA